MRRARCWRQKVANGLQILRQKNRAVLCDLLALAYEIAIADLGLRQSGSRRQDKHCLAQLFRRSRKWDGTLALQHASVAQDCWCIGELALATAGHPMVMATAGVLLVLNSLLNVLLVLNSLLSAVMNCLPVS